MDASDSVSVLWYRKSKPLGKVRRRVQDLRIPSTSWHDFIARPMLDLSHNESVRLAADSLLSRGLEGYHEVLRAEGEVDFLSEPEKNYILKNGADRNIDDPDEPQDDDKELESLSTGSQSPTQCSEVSMDSNRTLAESDQRSLKDVKSSGPVLGEHRIEVFFPSNCRAADMKDVVRQFIRKAKQALAIVVDIFSDVELLCDLLEASRKRSISVHLLLDHLNLNLFVSMWQDLKLNSKNFPKLSVHSVHGQTYCAKTGRMLRGQIAESFIISDWTEVLTGSYSFSWLSWQVNRSLAIIMKGSAVTPFLQEFHRLHSSSKAVTGFVSFISAPHTFCFHSTSHTAQNNRTGIIKQTSNQTDLCWVWNKNAENTQMIATVTVLCNLQSQELECSKGDDQPQHAADTGSQTQRKPPPLYPKPLVQPGIEYNVRSTSVEKPKFAMGAVGTTIDEKEKSQDQIQSHSNPPDQTYFSRVQPQRNITEKDAKVQESKPQTHGQHRPVHYQPTLKNSSVHKPDVATEGPFLQQRNRDMLKKPLGMAAGLNTQRSQWSSSQKCKPKEELPSDNPKLQPPSTPQQKQAKTTHHFPFKHPRGHTSGLQTKLSFAETRRQDQPQRYCQPPLQLQTNTELPGSMGAHVRPQLQKDYRLFLPGTAAQMHPQQMNPCPRINWIPQNHQAAGRPTAMVRHSSFRIPHRMGQMTEGQHGWRPVQSSMNTPLARSKSMTEGRTAGVFLNRSFT